MPTQAEARAEAERKAIRDLLEHLGMSAAECSRKADLNHAYLHQYLKEGTPPRLTEKTRMKLRAAYGIDPDALKEGRLAFLEKIGVQPADNAADDAVSLASIRAVILPGDQIALQAKTASGERFELVLTRSQAAALREMLQSLESARR